MDAFSPTGRTTVRRLPQRGVYDKAEVYAILDEGFICHVGFAVEGQPYVIPTGYARLGDESSPVGGFEAHQAAKRRESAG